MKRVSAVILCCFLLLLPATAIGGKKVKIYDENHRLKYTIEDGRVYDENHRRKGTIQGDKIYDENWRLKGRIQRDHDSDVHSEKAPSNRNRR